MIVVILYFIFSSVVIASLFWPDSKEERTWISPLGAIFFGIFLGWILFPIQLGVLFKEI